MVKLACFSNNDPEPPLIVLKILVFLVAAACVASDVLFFMRSTPENYGLLIWRLPLESAVCLTYLLSLLNQGWHRIRHKHKTIGKRRLLWMAPVIIALVALVVADMIREMSRIVRWRENHGNNNVRGLSVMAADGGGGSSNNGNDGNVRPDPAAANENAVTQFWTCALTNEFYKTASTATKIQHGPESNVGGWTGYCVPRNFGWCGGLALAVVFLADVAYSYAKRHQLQAKNEMAMKREQEEQECHSSSSSSSSSSHGGRRKEAEAHALTNVTSAHSRTADNLLA
ncbi:hypothetical protein BGW42_003193 [Actinomortierella wolfii]|nr:hypothetical protein BGW42_003193 [Actinomortierella wolfii]